MNDSENKLQEEILGDAERRADRLITRAKRDAKKDLDAVKAEHKTVAAKRLEAAEKEAEDIRRAISAGIGHEIKRRWLTLREERLQELLADVLQTVNAGEGFDRRESLRQMLVEALTAIGPTDVTVRADADHAALVDAGLVREAARTAWENPDAARIEVVTDASVDPGLAVESADGRRRFDNTYATRLERLHADLRALVSRDASALNTS